MTDNFPAPPAQDALLALAVLVRRLQVMTNQPVHITDRDLMEMGADWQVAILHEPHLCRYTVQVREAPQTIDAERSAPLVLTVGQEVVDL